MADVDDYWQNSKSRLNGSHYNSTQYLYWTYIFIRFNIKYSLKVTRSRSLTECLGVAGAAIVHPSTKSVDEIMDEYILKAYYEVFAHNFVNHNFALECSRAKLIIICPPKIATTKSLIFRD